MREKKERQAVGDNYTSAWARAWKDGPMHGTCGHGNRGMGKEQGENG